MQRRLLLAVMPIIFFGTLLFSRVSSPPELVFDEVHYVPAAKELILFHSNLNWVHPPLGKFIMGAGWLVFTHWLHWIPEPAVFRCMAIVFGLWTLWGIRAWMLALGFTPMASAMAMWLTGFNFLWFVQSKTAMLDIFFVAFAVWGVYDVWGTEPPRPLVRRASKKKERALSLRYWRGWIFIGLAGSCKWSAAPFAIVALFLASRPLFQRALGAGLAALIYALTFVPLAFLQTEPVPVSNIVTYHQLMFIGFSSIAAAQHPYLSQWWEWPTLIRPMWYLFDSTPAGQRNIWAGGNPVLFWTALPFLVLVVWHAIRFRDKMAECLAALYWGPLLFWVFAPRKLQMYYYYLAPSLWVGPIVVWAHHRFYNEVRQTRGWLLLGFVLLCAACFLYFLPIMDARPLPPGRFYNYMWLRSWI